MTAALVGKGDGTTTGGYVLSATSTTYDDGRPMSRHGDVATCGNCKGSHPIFGTVDSWFEGGLRMVKHRDRVMCPCGKNYVLARSDATIFISEGGGSSASAGPQSATSTTSSTGDSGHWIRFVLNESGSCEGLGCAAHFADGSVEYGTFDANNMVRFERDIGSACNRVELRFDGNENASGSVADFLLSKIME